MLKLNGESRIHVDFKFCIFFLHLIINIYFFRDTNSSAAGQMSASLSGGSVTRWTTVGTDRMNPLTAVSAMFFKGWL